MAKKKTAKKKPTPKKAAVKKTKARKPASKKLKPGLRILAMGGDGDPENPP